MIGKICKIGKTCKIGKIGKIGMIGKIGKIGMIGKIGKISKIFQSMAGLGSLSNLEFCNKNAIKQPNLVMGVDRNYCDL